MAVTAEPRTLRFAVIGAGMAGILSAIKLTEAGYTDFTVYEKADRPGGTWRENTYPGLACDVPSHLYSYSFALTPEWTHRYSPGPEIQAYFERIAREHDLEARTRYGDEVTRCEFLDGRWRLTTASGHRDDVDVVMAATGVLHHPNIPAFEGLERFEGAAFHSSRWDHRVALDGARVGVIGTGSTATQIVGAVVDDVAHLTLFQRTAQWIMPQENPPYSDDERREFRDDPQSLRGLHDHLCEQFDVFANAIVNAESPEMRLVERLCKEHLEEAVHDPALRERLRPDYRAACKRLVVSGRFYEAIQRPNAELVTEPIERAEPGGVRTRDGALHELDVLVLATGFQAHAFMRPMEVIGRDGHTFERRVEAAADGVPVHLDPPLPELLHAERAERPRRQLLAHRRRRAAVRLRAAARRPAPGRRAPGDQPDRGGDGRPRGRADRGGEGHDLDDRLSQLVPRRPWRAGGVAVLVRPLPRRDARARPGGLRPALISRRAGRPGRAGACRRASAGT